MRVQVVRAWPRRHESVQLELPEGARVRDAIAAAGWESDAEATGYAVFGAKAAPEATLSEGDRVELLRALAVDPKVARRKRAEARPLKPRPK